MIHILSYLLLKRKNLTRRCPRTYNWASVETGLRTEIFSQKMVFSGGKNCFKDKFRKCKTLHLYVISQLFPTLYGFRGVAAQ